MSKEVVSIESVTRPERPEPCGACQRPLSKIRYTWLGKDGETVYLICSRCYGLLQLSAEEKALAMQKARNEKQCSTCGIVKSEGIRAFGLSSGKVRHLCMECIERGAPSASEKWSLNQLEMKTKK